MLKMSNLLHGHKSGSVTGGYTHAPLKKVCVWGGGGGLVGGLWGGW
jgi:hypothetical protein